MTESVRRSLGNLDRWKPGRVPLGDSKVYSITYDEYVTQPFRVSIHYNTTSIEHGLSRRVHAISQNYLAVNVKTLSSEISPPRHSHDLYLPPPQTTMTKNTDQPTHVLYRVESEVYKLLTHLLDWILVLEFVRKESYCHTYTCCKWLDIPRHYSVCAGNSFWSFKVMRTSGTDLALICMNSPISTQNKDCKKLWFSSYGLWV